jgi:hypothetical protein
MTYLIRLAQKQNPIESQHGTLGITKCDPQINTRRARKQYEKTIHVFSQENNFDQLKAKKQGVTKPCE